MADLTDYKARFREKISALTRNPLEVEYPLAKSACPLLIAFENPNNLRRRMSNLLCLTYVPIGTILFCFALANALVTLETHMIGNLCIRYRRCGL